MVHRGVPGARAEGDQQGIGGFLTPCPSTPEHIGGTLPNDRNPIGICNTVLSVSALRS